MKEDKKQEIKECKSNIKISKLDAEYHKKKMEYCLFQLKIYETELKELSKK